MKTIIEWMETEEWVDGFIRALEAAGDMPADPDSLRYLAGRWDSFAVELRRRANEIERKNRESIHETKGGE